MAGTVVVPGSRLCVGDSEHQVHHRHLTSCCSRIWLKCILRRVGRLWSRPDHHTPQAGPGTYSQQGYIYSSLVGEVRLVTRPDKVRL